VKLPTALIGIVLIIGILVVLSMLRQPLGTLLALVQDQTALRQQVMAYGAWAPLLLAVIQLAQVILAFIPGHVLMIAAGYLYGLSGGFALNLITIVAASQLAFVLARRAGRPLVERLVPPHVMARVEERSGSGDVLLLAIGFLVPILPGDALNLLAGLSGISGQRFLLANLVGRLPAVLLWTLVGSHGIQLSPMVWAVIAAVAAVVGIVWMARSHLAAVLPGRAGEARRGNRLGVTFGG
jgi:uncharacterized membrane protein YdjX (TVP38/TMEM64 family)